MKLVFGGRWGDGAFEVGVESLEAGKVLARVLLAYDWHTKNYQKAGYAPSFSVYDMDEDGEPRCLHFEHLPRKPPWPT